MEYLVIYYAGYGDYEVEDEHIRIFRDEDKAIEYRDKLNNDEDVIDLCVGEYIVEPIKRGDK